jgi:hypothetical protein
MTPRSDLGIDSPTFDSRSEISIASRQPVPPESPRIDPLKSIEALDDLLPALAEPEPEVDANSKSLLNESPTDEKTDKPYEQPLSPEQTSATEQLILVFVHSHAFGNISHTLFLACSSFL